jgi:hypothetical protein
LSARTPVDHRGLAALPRLEHRRAGRVELDTLAGFEHMVVGVAFAGQPHAAALHHHFAGAAIEAQGFAPTHREDRRLPCVELRLHHQSPGFRSRLVAAPSHEYSVFAGSKSNDFDQPL